MQAKLSHGALSVLFLVATNGPSIAGPHNQGPHTPGQTHQGQVSQGQVSQGQVSQGNGTQASDNQFTQTTSFEIKGVKAINGQLVVTEE